MSAERRLEPTLTLELGQQVAETFSAMGDPSRVLILLKSRRLGEEVLRASRSPRAADSRGRSPRR